MKNARRRTAAALAFAVLALALPALAAPPACEISCSCASLCNKPCSFGGTVSTCGGFGLCRTECLAAAPRAESEAAVALDSLLLPPAEGLCGAAPLLKAE